MLQKPIPDVCHDDEHRHAWGQNGRDSSGGWVGNHSDDDQYHHRLLQWTEVKGSRGFWRRRRIVLGLFFLDLKRRGNKDSEPIAPCV